uniref:Uncharacterized protein TCIL3000_8_7150 n=1 Tax=Trypanosoma congolense (strain IL3000) TaxID=1068625 RepID=G0USX4_TRYCI|nr:unnamed protein product [Trypanosoma congolense IL3000]
MNEESDALTKAKLYVKMSDEDPWIEMGTGVVSIAARPVVEEDEEEEGQGDVQNGSSRPPPTIGHLEMTDINNPAELIISTPISLSEGYDVQQETILWWSDPKLGCLLSCSFNSREGCEKIYSGIVEYQRSHACAKASAEGSDEACSGELGGPSSQTSHWSVLRENLPAILSASITSTQRFGIFVRSHDTYVKELMELFAKCREEGDQRGMGLVGQITISLLRQPFCTDVKIMTQFIEATLIDSCLDVVQYGIGRCDKESGFVDREERRAAFRNPLQLPENVVAKIHELHACGCLKDLLPVNLEDADGTVYSLLGSHIMSSKFELVCDICQTSRTLPDVYVRAYDNPELAFEVVALLHDMCKTVRNSNVAFDRKLSVFHSMMESSLTAFLRFVLSNVLRMCDEEVTPSGVSPGVVLSMACDVISCCITMYPPGRSVLVEDARSKPEECVLELLLRGVVTCRHSGGLQAAVDAVMCCVVGTFQGLQLGKELEAASQCNVLQFWLGAVDGGRRPPLLLVVDGLVKALGSIESIMRGSREEARILHMLKVLTVTVGESPESLNALCVEVMQPSGLMQCLDRVMQCSARTAANLQSTVATFLTSLLNSKKPRLAPLLLLSDGWAVLNSAVRRLLACSPNSNCLLKSSLIHLVDALRRVIRAEKATGAENAPALMSAPNPFVRLMTPGEDDSLSVQHIDQNSTDTEAERKDVCLNAGNQLWQTHGEQMKRRLPTLAEKFEEVLWETPEEAAFASTDAEASSSVSNLERGVWSSKEMEFDAALMEFEHDAPRQQQQQPIGTVGDGEPSPHETTAVSDSAEGSAEQLNNNDQMDTAEECEESNGGTSDEPELKRSRRESPSATPDE